MGADANVTIPEDIEVLGISAFRDCKSIVSLAGGAKLREIGNFEFAGSTVASIAISASVERIGDSACSHCSALSSLTLESVSLRRIGEDAFGNCPVLQSVTIPGSVEVIGERCFWSCRSLAGIRFSKDSRLGRIERMTFSNCSGLEASNPSQCSGILALSTARIWRR
jgi:hypothetical protein